MAVVAFYFVNYLTDSAEQAQLSTDWPQIRKLSPAEDDSGKLSFYEVFSLSQIGSEKLRFYQVFGLSQIVDLHLDLDLDIITDLSYIHDQNFGSLF